jgi:hypothetical protein
VNCASAISEVFGKYLSADTLEIFKSSNGMLGSEKEPTTVDHKKPFAAIDQLRGYLKYSPHSPSVFFRDRDHVHLAPLGDLFHAAVLMDYIQKETWGIDMFDKDIYRSIIVAQADVDKNLMVKEAVVEAVRRYFKGRFTRSGVFDWFTGVATSSRKRLLWQVVTLVLVLRTRFHDVNKYDCRGVRRFT